MMEVIRAKQKKSNVNTMKANMVTAAKKPISLPLRTFLKRK